MKQNNARKVKIIRGMSLPKAKRSPEVRYYIGWDNCKKKTAKQGQNIFFLWETNFFVYDSALFYLEELWEVVDAWKEFVQPI